MGCACTKGEAIGPNKNGLERRHSSDTENLNNYEKKHTSEISKTEKSTSGIFRTLSLKKPFTNLFKESLQHKDLKLNESEEYKNNRPETLIPPVNTNAIQTTPIQERFTQTKKLTTGTNIYSFMNLPIKTQYLLNAQHEFDCEFANYLQCVPSNEMESLLENFSNNSNINKEIKIYVSTSLFEKNEFFSSIGKDDKNSLYSKLSSYCTQSSINCDLNLINFFNNKTNTINKYYRRLLGKIIISDLLSITKSTINNNYSTPGYFLFVIILSDSEFNDGKSLLCPNEIEVKDYEAYIKTDFNKQELILFHKWYLIPKHENKIYKLNQDNLFNSSNLNELDDLLDVFKMKFIRAENSDNEEENLGLKYLKSIQQEEIELVANHIDPSSIIWLNLTDSNENTKTNFNQMRFQAVLKLLQSHVLTHNYKECQTITNENLSSFLITSIKSLIDQYVEDLNKKLNSNHALKIDQCLSQEILKHYEIYKYLRVKNEFLNQKKPSRLEINAKFITIINEYLKNKSAKYPLIINNFKERPAYVSCDEIISKWISDSALSPKKNCSIVYRFCGHTFLSSDISTLIQSIFHQLCYLLDVHESWSFDNVSNIIDNLSKALESDKLENSEEEKTIIIFIDRIDRLIRSKYDQSILLNLLDKLYNNSLTSSNLKLVITYSSSSDLFANLIQPVKDLFKTNGEIIHSLSLSAKPIDSSSALNFNEQVDRLKNKLFNVFKENNLVEANQLVDVLIELLLKSRYGLKQNEIFDLLRHYYTSRFVSLKINLDYCIQILWYTFRNYSNLFKQYNLIETTVEHNQILFRLEKQYYPNKLDYLNDDLKIKGLLSNYFKSAIDKPNECLISNAKIRAYEELSNAYLVQNNEVYFKSFIINYSWLLNKLTCDCNILFFMQDLESFKRLLHLSGQSDLNLEKVTVENEKDEHKLFEHLFYETMYALHQDPNQIYNQFKTYLNISIKLNKTNHMLQNMLTGLEKHFKTISHNSNLLIPLNFEFIIEHEMRKLDKEKISFNNLKNSSTYLSKVVFLNANTILALSDTHNEIKIWKINNTFIELVRSIKLNKTPRDLRLLNQKIAVILVDRNLHLFDLNESKHVLDMNSTMSANVPFFEIHDQNHVVLLARNRLSVILMKVSPPKEDDTKDESNDKNQDTTLAHHAATKTYSVDDDMFLFKVGEDRYLNSLLVSKNGQVMVCGDEVQKPFPLLVWNLNKRKLVYDLRQAKHEFITSIQSIGSSGKFVVCACQEEGELKNCLILYDLLTGQLFKKLKAKSNYVAVEISEESNVLIACLENSQIIVYDLNNGSEKCTINSNRFPVNKIKILDNNKQIFITCDTRGYDWTIRAWDLTKLDKNPLISSFTCPTRIISCSINVDHFNSNTTGDTDEIFIGLALYGIQQPLILKLNNQIINKASPVSGNNSELFNKIEHFNKEINL